jgi:hypothetical protein
MAVSAVVVLVAERGDEREHVERHPCASLARKRRATARERE